MGFYMANNLNKSLKITSIIALLFSGQTEVFAEHDSMHLSDVEVHGKHIVILPELTEDAINDSEIKSQSAKTSDTASLLQEIPGVNVYGAGGVSSLPVVHGLADDRLRIKVDGMDLVASCPNHMNSPLSYIDPTNIDTLKVYSGISPVSVGGDSIGAVIIADTKEPEFAATGEIITKGELGARYRSNNNSRGFNASATLATENFNISYSGSTVEADNYKAGSNFKNYKATGRPGHELDKDEVGSTAYKSTNHTINLALKNDNHMISAKLGYQDIPYELYPNQRMDMLDNEQTRLSLKYLGNFNWGNFEARAYREKVDHYMDFGDDKMLAYGTAPMIASGMPMYTEGKTKGASAKAEIDLSDKHLLRVGAEYQNYRLDDWWPPSPNCGVGNCIGGMAPLTFWNINNGERDRKGIFGEWQAKWSQEWLSLLGVRVENVRTDVDPVVGYFTSTTPLLNTLPMMMRGMYETSSVGTRSAFNSMNKEQTDVNVDLSALAHYTPDEKRSFEFGYAQKTRSPNLYERYAWSTATMAMEMVNMVGDGNGYVGNPNLDPEKAHTLSATGNWHSADHKWEFKATPYFTYIDDYIDVIRRPTYTTTTSKFVLLQYANQSARLYGLDLSGKMPLGNNAYGDWGLKGFVSYVKGENRDTGDDLYNMMPLNAKIALTNKFGDWDNAVEVVGVKSKDNVSDVRNEIKTAGYSLVNLKSSYSWKNLRLDFGVDNLFDKMYYLPLGGAYTGQGATMSFNKEVGTIGASGGTQSMWGTAVPGMGRSLYLGMNIKF